MEDSNLKSLLNDTHKRTERDEITHILQNYDNEEEKLSS